MAGELDILQWEEDHVVEWLISINLGQYQGSIYGLLPFLKPPISRSKR